MHLPNILPNIILASASPRRRELLEQAGFSFTVIPSQKEEIITRTVPNEVVEELSFQKAQDIALKQTEPALIIGADTIVSLNGTIMGKPSSEEHAFQMLHSLQGQTHQVYTGVTIYLQQDKPRFLTFSECTEVTMYPMSEEEIYSYISTKDPMDKTNVPIWNTKNISYQWEDKAGGYGIQTSFGAKYIKKINGDYNNVVGLPISRLYQELKSFIRNSE